MIQERVREREPHEQGIVGEKERKEKEKAKEEDDQQSVGKHCASSSNKKAEPYARMQKFL